MSWKIAMVVALVTGLVTAAVAIPLSDKVTGMQSVSDFEGKRGYLIAFVLIPAAFVAGALLGLVGTKLVGATAWPQFWKAAGVSVAMGQVAIFGVAGLSLLAVPRAPTAAGEELAIEVEVHVPLARVTERTRELHHIRLGLNAGPKDNRSVTVDPALYREEGTDLIVPAVAPLYSKSYRRAFNFHLGEDLWLAYDLEGLAATPEGDDFEWSALAPLRDARVAGGPADSDVRLRWRVVRVRGEG